MEKGLPPPRYRWGWGWRVALLGSPSHGEGGEGWPGAAREPAGRAQAAPAQQRVIKACGSDLTEEQGERVEGHILAQTRHPHPEPAWLFQWCSHGECSPQSQYLSKRVRAWVLHSSVPGTQDQFC